METHRNTLTINCVEELEQLLAVRWLERRNTTVIVGLAGLDEVEKRLLAYKINRYYNACGCGEGKFFIVLALAVFLIRGVVQGQLYWDWYNVGVAFLYCLGGAFIGKAWGQLYAYFKLRKCIRKTLSKLAVYAPAYGQE